MGDIFLKLYFLAFFLHYSEGAACNAYTGAVIRDYDFDYTSDSLTNDQKRLANVEHNQNHVDTEFVMTNSDYEITCDCGVVTMWQFFAWKPGTVIFYVLDGTEVIGKTSFTILDQSDQNFHEVPLSSDMWIQVKNGNTIAFYTEDLPMITYRGNQAGYTMYFARNVGERNVGDHVTVEASGNSKTNRKYAFAAYVSDAHQPMFVNAPYETTIYTHNTATVVFTATVIDLDQQEVAVTKTSGDAAFVFDTSLLTLTYNSALDQGTYTVTLQADDGCAAHVNTVNIVINVVNEGPMFTNLPASITVAEDAAAASTLYTISTTDASGDSVTCSRSSNPASGYSIFSISGFHIVQGLNPNYDYSTTKYYDLEISCSDGQTTRYSNFQVDVVKNEPPYYNAGSGYLPASISVERSSGVTIYTLDYTDPESDAVTVTLACSGGGACPFSQAASAISTSSVLNAEAYDLVVTLADAKNSFSATLSIVVSGRPYTFNANPVFVNLDATIHVMEHTAIGTFLFKVLYTDENPTDTFTLAKVSSNAADTYFAFDASTGIISVQADIDFDPGIANMVMEISVNDGSETQHVTETGTVTFVVVNINEGITIVIGNPAISADETRTRGDVFTSPDISSVDIDAGDTAYYTMDCGADSKYFYLDTATLQVKFAREYDMDSGMSGTATCDVTVRDEKGLSDTDQITLTVNNINDHHPKFPHNKYVFFVSTTTPFFTELTNMAATDADSDAFGSTAGTLTYNFNPVTPTEEYFQLDVAGVLYVRNLTTYALNTYVFEVIATDSGSLTGTCTVTVIFRPVSTTVTTTTERPLIFKDDYLNYVWLLLCAVGIFATMIVIAVMMWKDPVINEYINFKIYKLCIWCRKRPKHKVPKRTVGKLRVTINKKDLENDPDNALPWELLAKDNQGPEVNEVQEMIEHRREKRDRDYKNFSGLPVFEKGKGERPDSGRATVHSSTSSQGRPESDSPKYATFMSPDDKQDEDGGEGQWGDLTERHVIVTPVAPAPGAEADNNSEIEEPRSDSPEW